MIFIIILIKHNEALQGTNKRENLSFQSLFFKEYKDGIVRAVDIDLIDEKELNLKTLYRLD